MNRLDQRALDWRIQAARRRLAERDARQLVDDPSGPEPDIDRVRREARGLIFDEREAEEKPDTSDTSWMIS